MNALRKLELVDPRWQSFVAARPEATAFHHPAWAELLADCYGHQPFALGVFDHGGELVGGLPFLETRTFRGRRRWISLPFTDTCEPLALDQAARRALAEGLEDVRVEAGLERLEVRSEIAGPGVARSSEAVRHVLELDRDEDAVLRRLSRSQRWNVHRAEREGVVVRRGETCADVDQTFYALQVETRRRLGVPIQPRRFYTLLWERMLEPGRGFLLLAYSGVNPVAGAVFLSSGGTLTYKYSASSKAYWRLRANALVLWTAIADGCATGRATMDFGRTELRHEGLRSFKRDWATRELPLVYSVLGAASARRPSTLATSFLAYVIRNSPPLVCRAIGAGFYRYA